jgi:4-amino-4-deoxy-L-arabinose transferase-like glycosyltransferase
MRLLLKNEVIIIVILGVLFFIPYLGSVHLFDWDEVNFAECSREMMVLNDYTRVYVDFKPFWEKPPMFFWMQSTAMEIFGVTEFAARFPNAICGIATLLVLFLCGTKLYDRKFGLFWALAYGGSLFPNMYFKSGIIDPWFNLFIFLSIYFLIFYHWKKNGFDKEGLQKKLLAYTCLSGIFMGLAILTKGQVALMVFLLVLGVYLIYNRFRIYFNWWHVGLFFIVTFLVTLTWYGYETAKNGPWFIEEFLKYQYRLFTTHDAGQKGFFGYHFVVILIGCFPASLFAIPAFFKTSFNSKYEKDFRAWMLILFWVVTILFTIVQSRIIHYSSLAWFPVTFLAAYSLYKWERKEKPFPQYVKYLVIILGGLVSLALIAVPFFAMNLGAFIPYVKNEYVKAAMQAEVHWSGWESLIGVLMIIFLYLGLRRINRKKFISAAWILFGGTAIVVFLASSVIVMKVERYSQGAAIDFFIARQGEDCYAQSLGYKTYADLFYTQKVKPANEYYYDINWLLTGDIDKPVYFSTKIDRVKKYEQYKDLKELYRKNGFVFFKREIPIP